MYFILAVLLVRPLKTLKLPVWFLTLLISVIVGGVIEILQYVITTYRSANWGDFGADVAGAVGGLVVYGWIVPGDDGRDGFDGMGKFSTQRPKGTK